MCENTCSNDVLLWLRKYAASTLTKNDCSACMVPVTIRAKC
jgi:hypothetical protein